MTVASRSAKTEALSLPTGRRYFFPRFSDEYEADIEHNVPATSRFTSAPWSPLASKRQKAPVLQATFDSI